LLANAVAVADRSPAALPVSTLIEPLRVLALDICKSRERDMTEEVRMATQNNDQTVNRNDPAINPETPDSSLAQNDALKNQGESQSQENNGNPTGENSFTPDFEPEEHESPDTTKEERQTGELDKDIDTAGG
jgi:hypothetical protein